MNEFCDSVLFGLKAICLAVIVPVIAGLCCKIAVLLFLKGWMLI